MSELQITITLFLAAILVASYTTFKLLCLVMLLVKGFNKIDTDIHFYILVTGYPIATTLFILAAKSF